MTDHKIRCVVTGLGMVSAIGNTADECWENAKAGKSGIKPATSVVTEGCYANLGAEVSAPDLDTLPGAEEMDRVSRLCVKAAGEAVRDAGLDMQKEDAGRVGVIMGSCVGGVVSIENYYRNGERAEDVTKMPISAIANMVARAYGAGGVVTNVANACAAGTISIAYACDLIRAGVGDVFIAGGADAFASVPYAGFLSLHALDALPCSPFNRCSGITLGEGSGALVIESYDHAVARGAHIICEVLGAGVSSDAHHITAPRPDGEGQMNAILRALKNSGLTPKDISYINAHGTGTAKNDEAEFLSLHTIFDAENDDLSVSSTKAMVGHCLGAAGAIEAVFTVKALTDGVVPPTVGYTDEDLVRLSERAGKIDFRPNVAREKQMTNVMSNSFAFGGNNASIVFSREAGNVTLPEKKQDVYITGLGLVLPGGNGIPAYLERAAKGEAPDSPSVMSAVGHDDFDACGLKMAFYRKLDKFSQLQAVSGMEALADAHLTVTDDNATEIGIVVGTSEGPLSTVCDFQRDIVAKGNASGSAFKFPNTVYNAAGGYLSICSGIKGYNVTVTNGAQSGLSGIAYAMNIIREGQESIMLATGTDENSEIIDSLYRKLGLVSDHVHGAYANDAGFVLGDGSVSLVLESADSVKARGAAPYAKVLGYGMANAGVKFGTVSGSEEAVARAIRTACNDAGITLADVDAVIGFANGQAAVDKTEIGAYRLAFGDAKLTALPLLSVKDTVGECRAASAALSAAEAALLFSGKRGSEVKAYLANGETVQTTVVKTESLRHILAVAVAAGGAVTAVLLGRA